MAPSPRTSRRPWPHAMSLAGLLVCTLALATMLAYAAHDAARSHRATAERALHDYAAVAAWELVAAVNEEVQGSLSGALAPVTRARAGSPYELLAAPAVLAASADSVLRCPNPADDSARFYFRLDFLHGTLSTAGATPSDAMRAWVADTIGAQVKNVYKPGWNYAVVLGGPSVNERRAIAYAVKYAAHSAPIAAYGFTTCGDVVGASMIRRLIAQRALLPASVTDGARNDSIISVSVRGPMGRIIYQSSRNEPSPYWANAALEQVGPITVHAAIRPSAVQALALGAIPESRVPWLVGLLVLTAAMIVITVMQLRREQELSRLRSDFISSVSHELRTPLSQILLFAETLNLGRVRTDHERNAATGVIVQEGRRLMHLVENILHFSRAERHMSRLGLEPIDLSQTVASIVDDWRPLAEAADVEVRTRLAADVHAIADRSALRQMVLNLLDNAVKYGPAHQTVTIGTGLVTTATGARVRVWVDDEGDGIPPRERERVWDSFYRLDRHADSSVAGSGIGLYVVRELARLHDGDAWVADTEHGGARIVIELPAAPRAAGFTDEHPSPSRGSLAEPPAVTRR